MSKQYIQNIEDITDSKEVMYEYPRRSVSLLAYIIIGLLVAAIIWSLIGEIDYYVKATGIVRPQDNVNNIVASVTGIITKCDISEGKTVSKGDILFEYDSQSARNMLDTDNSDKDNLEKDLTYLNKLKECVENNKNTFNKDNQFEKQYFYMYEKYMTNINANIEQYKNNNLDINSTKKDNESTLTKLKNNSLLLEENKSKLSNLINNIKSNKDNNINKDNTGIYYKDYQQYISSVNQVKATISDQVEVEKEISALKDQFLNNCNNSLSELNTNITINNIDINNTNTIISNLSKKGYSEEIIKQQLKINMIISCNDLISQKKSSISTIQKEIYQLNTTIQNSVVKTPIDGIVTVLTPINVGDTLQSGQQICSILPDQNSNYKVMLYINPKDIADIKKDQKVKIRLSSMPYNDYGEITGIIKSVSQDSRSDNNGNMFYTAECEISNTKLKSKDGNVKSVSSGMTGEMHVITKQRKIFFWLLEKLNFID